MKVDGKKKNGEAARAGDSKRTIGGRIVWYNPKPSAPDVQWLEGENDNHVKHVVDLVDGLSTAERISVKFDLHSTRWLAILFVLPDTKEDATQALSVRGASAFDAIVLLHYFHCIKFVDGWVRDDSEVSGKYG